MIEIRRYSPDLSCRWDEFIDVSANGTFLHRRGYMDYHSERFTDSSLVVTNGNGHIRAVFPANREGDTLVSHRGLTYGGLIVARRHFPDMLVEEATGLIIDWCRSQDIRRLLYRPVPHIYHRYPAEADIYALSAFGAQLCSASVSGTIPLDEPRLHNESMRQATKRARAAGLEAGFATDLKEFHAILTRCLAERHDTAPVHTLAELELLASRFPDNIRLVAVTDDSRSMCGGMLLYITDTVIHTQYIATTLTGRQLGAIALAVDFVCSLPHPSQRRWLDFGTSAEPSTGRLNPGLSGQKYSLGGRPVVYPQYIINL